MKNLMKGICFVLIVVLGMMALSPVLEPKNNDPDMGMEDKSCNGILAEPEESIDAFFVGDSEVYASISPRVIYSSSGITSYSLSTGRQYLYHTMTVLRRGYRTQDPKLVFLETDAIFRKCELGDSMLEELGNLCPAIYYHDNWKNRRWADIWEKPAYNNVLFHKGFRRDKREKPAPEEAIKNYMKASKSEAEITGINRYYIEQIKKLVEENGGTLILYSTPSTKNWNTKRHNAIQTLAEELDLTYIDLNENVDAVGIDWKLDSADGGDHMNRYGAEKVSKYMAAYLTQSGLFTDHRSDDFNPTYADWNGEKTWQMH